MSVRFCWEPRYSVGNAEIDSQHKYIIELADSLPEEIEAPQIRKTIMELYKYVGDHFAAEEKMQRDLGYHAANLHHDLHEELISKLNEIAVSAFADGNSIFVFKKFVYDWIIEHILHRDMDFFRFAQASRPELV